MTDLTIQERLRVYAAAGGAPIDPKFMREIADAMDDADSTMALADQFLADGRASFKEALDIYEKSQRQNYKTLAFLVSWSAILFWVFA